MSDSIKNFEKEVANNIAGLGRDRDMLDLSRIWLRDTLKHHYSYNFSWLSRPIIQYPQDIVAMQELIWTVKPDLIIETGIAYGGSLIMSASMLAMIDYCEAVTMGRALDPKETRRRVLGIDIEIRPHNRTAVESHPMSHRIDMIEGSSIAADVIAQVREMAQRYDRIMVALDSNHTHDHVLAELEAYAPLVSKDSYCVVFDTIVEDLPDNMYPDRPWGKGNNPKTAVWQYVRSHPEFAVDKHVQNKLLITVAPEGFLKRVG